MGEDYAEWLADYVWSSYTRAYGTPKRINRLMLGHLTRFFVDECKKRGIDPQSIDFYSEIFEDLSYEELKGKVVEILSLIKPMPTEPVEVGLDVALEEVEKLGFKVREEDLRKIENVKALESKIERLTRNVERLRRELELEKARREAVLRELERARGTEEEVKRRLYDEFSRELTRNLGRVPENAVERFSKLFEEVKTKPYEEARTAVLELAWDIISEAVKIPRPPKEKKVEALIWPRKLTKEEVESLRQAFRAELGAKVRWYPEYDEAFDREIAERTWNSFEEARDATAKLVESILVGAYVFPEVPLKVPKEWASAEGMIRHLTRVGYDVETISEEVNVPVEKVREVMWDELLKFNFFGRREEHVARQLGLSVEEFRKKLGK